MCGALLLGGAVALISGCYKPTRGNPVDEFHYVHSITVARDYSQASIQTYVNRTQWKVGLRREDLFDGDHDGTLTRPGMDRVFVTEYDNVEDPPESAVRSAGEIEAYDARFREILEAARAGKKTFAIDKIEYEMRTATLDMSGAGD
jgi:hypothetical protein